MENSDCCILNAGGGAWAFDALARQLAAALALDIAEVPRKFNYVLFTDDVAQITAEWFIPRAAMVLASDKRLLAEAFAQHKVPTPRTWLVEDSAAITRILQAHADKRWCLKYPLACGAFGHTLLASDTPIPADWPRPFIVQEFIPLERPEVYRTYGAGGEIFGWIARRFPTGAKPSPWVAHARGARYERCGPLPAAAAKTARQALQATGLLASFGCVDLLPTPGGAWLVLEVGTDGLFNHVDRELHDPELEQEIQRRIAEAFWAQARIGAVGTKNVSAQPD
jgi:glutathione synthase/RimK-type ligase-like ATP-grasp enzyme